ncbi:MAG TPA: hypothetical protein VOA41_09685 [Candidatus Dormibacteraeota bacterium]|nr:hypothetical protein [Candidatus Dormibacteraeota bacterium]
MNPIPSPAPYAGQTLVTARHQITGEANKDDTLLVDSIDVPDYLHQNKQ